MKLLEPVLISLVLFLHLLVLAPLYVLSGNEGQSTLGLADILLGWPVAAAIILAGLLAGLLAMATRRGMVRLVAAASAVAFFLLVTFYFANFSLGLLDGNQPNFGAMWPQAVIEVLLAGALLIGIAWFPRKLHHVLFRLAFAFFFVQAALLGYQSAIAAEPTPAAHEAVTAAKPAATAAHPPTLLFFRNFGKPAPEVVAPENAIVILIDTLQADVFEAAVASDPELRETFSGFTLFSDAAGLFPFTGLSVPAVLTGEGYSAQEETIPDYLRRVSQKQLSAKFEDAGFGSASLMLESRARYLSPEGGKCREYGALFDLILYRQAPVLLKPAVFDEGRMQVQRRCSPDVPPTHSEVDLAVISKLIEETRLVQGPAKFTFIHLWGSHPPARLSRSCEVVPVSAEFGRLVDQSICLLRSVGSYLDKLRSLGVFDESLVFIVGDHGTRTRFVESPVTNEGVPLFVRSAANPAIAFHAPGDTAPFRVDDSPVSLLDVYPTILSVSSLQSSVMAPTLTEVEGPRKRDFIYFKSSKEFRQEHLSGGFARFVIDGPVKESASWTRVAGGETDAPLEMVNFGVPETADQLGFGWSIEETKTENIDGWAWSIANPASVTGVLPEADSYTLKLRLQNPHPAQVLRVEIQGDAVATFDPLPVGWSDQTIPFEGGNWPEGPVSIDFYTSVNDQLSELDPRPLGVRVDWIAVEPD